jgi:hypothetical protein
MSGGAGMGEGGRSGMRGKSVGDVFVGPPPRRRRAGGAYCSCQAECVVLEDKGVPGS